MSSTKILIVEDDMIIQLFLNKVLTDAGFDVVGEARNSSEAIELASTLRPDLILMDIGLDGDVDGVGTAEEINKLMSVPIVFMTGNSDQATLERARKTNPKDFIFKPIDEDRLKRKMLEIVNA